MQTLYLLLMRHTEPSHGVAKRERLICFRQKLVGILPFHVVVSPYSVFYDIGAGTFRMYVQIVPDYSVYVHVSTWCTEMGCYIEHSTTARTVDWR